ncbi:MAG: UDP-N-acetylglucosamine 4,6-dehydratase (inverting) [Planctomycetota bacterium]
MEGRRHDGGAASGGLRGVSGEESTVIDWSSANVLVTGGTGSFGHSFTEVMLEEYHPRKLIIYSRDEWKQHMMRSNGFDHRSMRYFIGDVRDRDRLRRAMQDVDIVVHAAALKQVPTCEYNPIEAVATNINGSRNVIEAALDNHVKRVLALSTDKATAPLNIYGATKLVAEKLFVHANHYNRDPATRFSCVRYGNVLGSRGSVVPLFAEQKTDGELNITDARMTRFWMTLEQGVRFVISCIESMLGGEVFIPRLPSMKVVDLARAVAPDARINYIGIRPGEKLHESLLSEEEARAAVDVGDRFIMLPADQPSVVREWEEVGVSLAEGSSYSSDANDRWLTSEEMLELIDATAEVCHV